MAQHVAGLPKAILAAFHQWHETAKILRRSQSPIAQYREFALKMATNPLVMMFIAIIPLSVLSRFTNPPFRDLSLLANSAILTIAALLYAWALKAWLGRWSYFAVWWNIPLVVVYSAFYTTAHVIFHLGFGGLLMDASFARSWERFWISYPFSIFLSCVAIAFVSPLARSLLSKHSALVPVLLPVSVKVARQINAFDATDIGKLRWMQAQQKGTRVVTQQKAVFVRRALAELIAQVQPKLGVHCHRSLWVAKDEVRDVVHINGNPHVVLMDETVFPISRSATEELRALAKQNKVQARPKMATQSP